MEWQPIETAPKDGTRILACGGRRGPIYIVHWDDDAEFEQFNNGPGWQLWECEDQFYSTALYPGELTHWMPLPEPPEE